MILRRILNERSAGRENCSAPRMIVFITRTEEDKKLEEIFDSMHIPICYQCRGQGTAPSELMDIFGLGGTARLITISFLPKFAVKELFEKTEKRFAFHQRGGGIVITIPVTGLQKPAVSYAQRRIAHHGGKTN